MMDDSLLRCPACGHVASLDSFDVVGADVGYLFCTQCHFLALAMITRALEAKP